jgi:hypothetical protein
LPGLRDDYKPDSSFISSVEKEQTGANEVSLTVKVELHDACLTDLIRNDMAQIVCHIESPLSSYRMTQEIDLFDLQTTLPIEPQHMRGVLEITPFIVAKQEIKEFSNDMFSDFYKGTYRIEKGDVLAFTPTIEIEIEPEDIDKRPTQSIIKVSGHDKREMTTDLTGEYILIRLPHATYSGYKSLSAKENSFHKISLMAVILPALMDALIELKTGEGASEEKIWARVILAKLKAAGRGSNVALLDPLSHAQFLLNNPADGAFEPIINDSGDQL